MPYWCSSSTQVTNLSPDLFLSIGPRWLMPRMYCSHIWLIVLPLDVPDLIASLLLWGPSGQRWRCLWTFLFFSNVPSFATSRLQEILAAKGGTTRARNGRWHPCNIQGSFTCRKSMTWDRRLYFPSEGRRAEDFFFALKNPTASGGFEPANLGTKGYHATSRPSKPFIAMFVCDCCVSQSSQSTNSWRHTCIIYTDRVPTRSANWTSSWHMRRAGSSRKAQQTESQWTRRLYSPTSFHFTQLFISGQTILTSPYCKPDWLQRRVTNPVSISCTYTYNWVHLTGTFCDTSSVRTSTLKMDAAYCIETYQLTTPCHAKPRNTTILCRNRSQNMPTRYDLW